MIFRRVTLSAGTAAEEIMFDFRLIVSRLNVPALNVPALNVTALNVTAAAS
jgi:hypothetical protein